MQFKVPERAVIVLPTALQQKIKYAQLGFTPAFLQRYKDLLWQTQMVCDPLFGSILNSLFTNYILVSLWFFFLKRPKFINLFNSIINQYTICPDFKEQLSFIQFMIRQGITVTYFGSPSIIQLPRKKKKQYKLTHHFRCLYSQTQTDAVNLFWTSNSKYKVLLVSFSSMINPETIKVLNTGKEH